MSVDNRLLVVFTELQYSQHRVGHMVRLSRNVIRSVNGGYWDTPIRVITDDKELAVMALPSTDSTPTALFTNTNGICWPTAGVIWVSPKMTPTSSHALVLAHEVAHSLSPGSHGELWRRNYMRLLPLWHQAFTGFTLSGEQTFNEARRIVKRYGHYTTDRRAGEEMGRLDNIAEMSWNRWEHEVP